MRYTRRRVLGLLGASAAAMAVPRSARASHMPADVLVIVADDQRNASLNVMPFVTAEIAGRGVTFDTACVAIPVCGPNRVSLLTGRYANHHGCYANGRAALDFGDRWSDRHIGVWVQREGYRTGMFGK